MSILSYAPQFIALIIFASILGFLILRVMNTRGLCSLRFGLKDATIALLAISFVPVHAQTTLPAQPGWIGWPSADENDGRFLAITGPLSAIDYVVPNIIIGIPDDATQFDIELFDGDAGSEITTKYDINFNSSGYTYTLFQDPNRDGTGSAVELNRTHADFADDNWSSYITSHPVNPAALGQGGFYWYRLSLAFNGNPDTEQFFNAMKVRVRSNATSAVSVGAFKEIIIGSSPFNPTLDPGLGSPENTYDGDWLFNVRVTNGATPPLEFSDSDADYVSDANAPGVPPDDNFARPEFKISPSIRYELFAPNGDLITLNTDPSGTEEEETFSYNPPVAAPAGLYQWHWFGVDASNVLILRTDFELLPVSYENPAVLGNYVWLDENADGLQDAGEPGLAGVRVVLKDNVGDTVATRVTDSDGGYLFDKLVPGTFTVEIDPSSLPVGVTQTQNPVLPGADLGNQSSPYTVELGSGDVNLTADFGFVYGDPDGNQGPGALGDKVWIDTNGNGIQDAGEAGLGGVELTIYTDTTGDGVINPGVDAAFTAAVDQDGNTGTGRTTTRADGSYLFNMLPADAYVVVVDASTLPVGYTQTADPDEFGVAATTADNQTTTPVVLGPGDVFLNVDFGYQPDTAAANTIGDTVFLDINANGAQDAGEPGIGDVSVSLLNASGEPIAYQTTDSNGVYLFEGLPDGDYKVMVTDTNGMLAALSQSADPDSLIDSMSSLSVSGGESNLDQDFGYTADSHKSAEGLLGDTVFIDRDLNGQPDAGEGLGFVRVQLYDVTGTALVAETITNADGLYLFGGLDSSASYTVVVDTTTLPAGLVNTVDPDGGNDSESIINLSVDPDGTNDGINLDQDFGYVIDTSAQTPGTIGDTVWLDVNADGINAGALGVDGIAGTADDEPGIEGVSLDLYLDSNGDGELQSGEPRVNSVLTDSTGMYLFDQLLAGDYIVDVSDSSGLLNGYWHSLGDADTNDHSQSDPYAVSLPNGGAIETADFGYYHELASVGNYVWFDANSNGLQDAGEPGIGDVEVELTINYPDGSQSILTTLTNSQGLYTFGNLLGDEDYNGDASDGSAEPVFTIRVDTPNGLTASPVDQGGDDALDSDNGAGEQAQPVMGGVDDSNDFGFYDRGSISGNVSEDIDRDGTIEGPLENVTVILYADDNQDGAADDLNGDGVINSADELSRESTDASGNYQFDDLEVGHYLVSEVDPANYESILDNDVDIDVPADGSEIANVNPRDNLLPVSLVVDLSSSSVEDDSGNNFVDSPILAGLGDTLWYDHNANGVQEASETGIANVTVNLLDENGTVIDTMVTDSNGGYQFTDLLAGTYTVVVDPSTFASALQQTYDLDDGISTNPATADAATVTLAVGDTNNEVDFGYRPLGSLGDTVWNDSNANGVLDAGEAGMAGVTVTLTGPVSGTTTTDANGVYEFTGLPLGTYTVSVSGSALDDFEQTHDLDDPATRTPSTANTTDVDLVLAATGDAVVSRDDVDFGYYQQLSTISGTVLEDSTGDNAGDRALQDNNGDPVTVMLTLFNADASGNPVGQSLAVTTANTTTGAYEFADLLQGNYVIIQTQPSGFTSIVDHDASADGDSFDSDTTVDERIAVTIKSGETEDDGNNFVEQRLASISGWVAVDTNASGHGDTALPGVQLTLLDANGNAVGSTTSSTGGGYSFTGLLPGDYTVVETQPAGYSSVKDEDADTTGYGDPDPQDADKAIDDKVGVNLKPGESDISNNFVERALQPAIDIRKQAEGDDLRAFAPGDTVEFEIQVTNTGSVDLNNVVVTDPQLPACDRVIGFLGFGQSTTYTCSMVLGAGESVSKTWLDNFSPAYSYSGNDGNTNFLGNWVEHDPQAGGASSGRVLVGSNYKLWMNNYGYPGGSSYKPYAVRGADLSGMTTATLSFDWVTHSGVDSDDAVVLHVKPEGGSWTQLDKFWGANTSGKFESYDITPYISANTKFRFKVSNYYGGQDETFKLDNFKIVAASSSAPAQGFINVADVTGEALGITVTDSDPSEVVVEAPAACEVCTYGQSQVTLKVSNWASNRDQNETIRVREGGLGGALLYEGRVSNGGSFTFDVSNPGTTIVVTVQGYYHPSEYVKGYFVTDCNLNVNYTNGNSYITFQVANVVGDGEDEEACPGGPVVPPVTSGVTTTITNAYAGLCLDTLGVDTNSSVYKRSCSGATNQKWELKPQGNYFEITNADSNLCLDVYNSSGSVNSEVGQWSCSQGSNQLWDIQTYGGNYLIKSKSSGLCLEIQGTGKAYQYTCDGYVGQQWSLTKP